MSYKHNRKLVQLFLLFCICYYLISLPQVSASKGFLWMKKNGGEGRDEVYSSMVTSDGHLVLVGSTDSWTERHSELYVQKLDQKGNMVWELSFGEIEQGVREDDIGYSVIEALDGNYLITGLTSHPEGLGDDLLLLKISKSGSLLWHREYGLNAWDWGHDLLELGDGSIVVVGSSQEFAMGYYDFYLVKTYQDGNEQWYRAYRIQGQNYANSVIRGNDGGFLMVGTTVDTGGTDHDILVIKVDNEGDIIWTKEYGEESKENGYDIISCSKGGYYIVGDSNRFKDRRYDVCLIKIDEEGNIQWERYYGSDKDDHGRSLIETEDGGLLITGQSFQNPENSSDILLIKINNQGELEFNETYGTSGYDTGVKTHPFGTNSFYITANLEGNNMDFGLIKISLRKYNLNIISEYGEFTGSGEYYEGSKPNIEIKDYVIRSGEGTRYIFTGWTSNNPHGYSGSETEAQVFMYSDITQIANWKKQHYLEMSTSDNGQISPESGWYDAGSRIYISVNPNPGIEFEKWRGTGQGSYSGTDRVQEIIIDGPIKQTAYFKEIPHLYFNVSSKHGETTGTGTYQKGTTVEFSVSPPLIMVNDTERLVFDEWVSSQENGYSWKNSSEEIRLETPLQLSAKWKKQYYVMVNSSEGGEVFGAGWYDEGEKAKIECISDKGYLLDNWYGSGPGSYTGNTVNFSLTVYGPIIEEAVFREAETYSLTIENTLNQSLSTKIYFEREKIHLKIPEEVIDYGNKTRYIFKKWESSEPTGYKGTDPSPILRIEEDIHQKIIWQKQYYIEFDSPKEINLSGWYDEGTIIPVTKHKTGLLIEKELSYRVDGTEIENELKINRPLTVNVIWTTIYYKLYIFIASITIIGSVTTYTTYDIYKTNKETQHILEQYDGLSIIDVNILKKEVKKTKIYNNIINKLEDHYIFDYSQHYLLSINYFSENNKQNIIENLYIKNKVEVYQSSLCQLAQIEKTSTVEINNYRDCGLNKLELEKDFPFKINGINIKTLSFKTEINRSKILYTIQKLSIKSQFIERIKESKLIEVNYEIGKNLLENTPSVIIPEGLEKVDIISMSPLLFPKAKLIDIGEGVYIEETQKIKSPPKNKKKIIKKRKAKKNESKLNPLIKDLTCDDRLKRKNAYQVLKKHDKSIIPHLFEEFYEVDSYYKWKIIQLIGEIGDRTHIHELKELENHEEDRVRIYSKLAIRSIKRRN